LTADRDGKPRSAYYFDGINDYIHVPFSSDFDFSDEKEISYGFWADTFSVSFSLHAPHSEFGFFLSGNEQDGIFTGITASYFWIFLRHHFTVKNHWYHCFVTADDKIMTMYFDGKRVKQASLYNVKWNEICLVGGLYICTEVDGAKPSFLSFAKGTIDEIRVYNRVLSPKEILQLTSKRD